MPNLTPTQLVGIALIAAGLLWWLSPPVLAWIATRRRQTPPPASDPAEALADRMSRLAQLQTDLEVRGHIDEADMAGSWYALLRDPIKQQEAPLP